MRNASGRHSASGARRAIAARPGTAFACYAAAAVATTWPVAARLGRAFPGMPGDQTYNAWCVDHFWWRVLAGESPFVTDRVLYPVGANLMHAITAPVVALAALPFYLTGSLVLYFGLLVLATVVVGAFGMRACVRALGVDDVSALVAGLLYAASPTVLSFADSSHHFKSAAAAILPWGLVALLAFLREPRRPRTMAALSLVAWGLLFTDYYVWLMFLVLTLTIGLTCVRRRHVVGIAVAAAVNGVAALVLVTLVLPSLDPSDLLVGGEGFWSRANINLADLLVPGAANPILGALARYASDRPNGDVECYYLGVAPVALAVLGLAMAGRRRRGAVALGVLAGGLLLGFLACGTVVRFGQDTLLRGPSTAWYWLVALAPLRTLDLPRCFVLGLQTAVAVLAALGLAALRARPAARALTALVLMLVAVEYGTTGIRTYTVPVPTVFRRLADLPDRTLLEVPSGVTESKRVFGYDFGTPSNSLQMYFQTIHHHRRVGAYLSRIPASTYQAFERMPILGDLFVMTSPTSWGTWRWARRTLDRLPDYPPDVVRGFIARLDLGYVVIQPGPREAAYRESVERVLAGHIDHVEEYDGFVLLVLRRDPGQS
jgi:hypothetical protein